MTNPFNEMLKPKFRAVHVLVGIIVGGATILMLSEIAQTGYQFGKDLRAQQEREAAQDVRQGD